MLNCHTSIIAISSVVVFGYFVLLKFTLTPHCHSSTNPPPADLTWNEHEGGRHNFRLPNRLVSSYDRAIADRINSLVHRKARGNDPEVIQLIRKLLDPPATRGRIRISYWNVKSPQALVVDRYLEKRRNGFFIECGAQDGERASNSMLFESDRRWTGLLIEMDPFFYTQLLGKNRRAWSINACISPFNYVAKIPYVGINGHQSPELVLGGDRSSHERSSLLEVPCFPFESFVLALNRSHVDFFSLDVEGVELDILKTVPFDRITIDVLAVEYALAKNKTEYVELMRDRKYRVYDEVVVKQLPVTFAEDYIFVKI